MMSVHEVPLPVRHADRLGLSYEVSPTGHAWPGPKCWQHHPFLPLQAVAGVGGSLRAAGLQIQ